MVFLLPLNSILPKNSWNNRIYMMIDLTDFTQNFRENDITKLYIPVEEPLLPWELWVVTDPSAEVSKLVLGGRTGVVAGVRPSNLSIIAPDNFTKKNIIIYYFFICWKKISLTSSSMFSLFFRISCANGSHFSNSNLIGKHRIMGHPFKMNHTVAEKYEFIGGYNMDFLSVTKTIFSIFVSHCSTHTLFAGYFLEGCSRTFPGGWRLFFFFCKGENVTHIFEIFRPVFLGQ